MSDVRQRGQILERIYAKGTWVARTPLHVGGGETDPDGAADMQLLSDAGGSFYIPGASIAGAGRSHLARLWTPAAKFREGLSEEPDVLQFLFGAEVDGYASPLTVGDAHLASDSTGGRLLRDGVRIDGATGCAARGAKYNLEALTAGAHFDFRLSLVIYRNLNHIDRDALVGEFLALLAAFEKEGEIPLGARTRRGLGHGCIQDGWRIWCLDMQKRTHLAAWLRRSWETDVEVSPPESLVSKQVQRPDERRRVSIDAQLRLKTSLLVRQAGAGAGDPDTKQLVERGAAIAPGSSLAGILRHRCRRIARTLLDESEADRLIDGMFGPVPANQGRGESLIAGRVTVWEADLPPSELLVQGRVSIDRFTGGALEGRLFDEAAYWPAPNQVQFMRAHIELAEPELQERDTALLLLAFKDLYSGDLPLGGETGVGRGVLEGVAATVFGPDREPWVFTGSWPGSAPEEWDSVVREFHARKGQ